ncbi:MAG: leucine--tRNA ligase [Thermoflexales bacterium]|nr:leucine--tRNA ligase [Thermoflexales bacterium]
MTDKYVPQDIEPKWQQRWEEDRLYQQTIDPAKKKFYALTMLPYPSGDLHTGHWFAMVPSDARARYMRMRGYNVLFPIGFDAFGLPAENAAIKHGVHPKEWTYKNIERMRTQLKSMGAMFDWEREAVSADPGYYRWSQWFFLQLYKAGLAYRKFAPVDFCPMCNTTLAREQVWGEDRHCERCETPVIKKDLEQWFFKTTAYADELLNFERIDWPERVRLLQTNWVGRSVGAEVTFKSEQGDDIVVFTTRPDTLWGATFMVLAPEHPLVAKLSTGECRAEVEAYAEQSRRQSDIDRESVTREKSGVSIGAYAINPVNDERIPIWIADYVLMSYGSGAIMAVPAHDERDFEFALKFGLPIIPVIDRPDGKAKSLVVAGSMSSGFEAALVEAGISAGRDAAANLLVTLEGQAQIERYVEIARQHLQVGFWNEVVGTAWVFIFADADGTELVPFDSTEADSVILSHCQQLEPGVRQARTLMEMLWGAEFYRDVLFHTEYGTMINSQSFSGTAGDVAKKNVTAWLEDQGRGKSAVNYRLRDWLISRQRYWGAPIPMIDCPKCGVVPVPESELPVLLPDDVQWRPTGESPLKFHEAFRNATCPQCGGEAERETDTMDTFMCSSWYQYRYLSPGYDEGPWDPQEGAYWLPVDCYTGGIEHATMHLIYTRFFTKALRDMGIVAFDEPMLQLRNQGMILGEDNEKMSKSRGNAVAPDEQVARFGADAMRAFLMFGYRWDQGGPWSNGGLEGAYRWLHRVWTLVLEEADGDRDRERERAERELRRATHKTIKRVSDDYERFEFNTIISSLMEFCNTLVEAKRTIAYGTPAWDEAIDMLLRLLSPACPHITEELWARRERPYSIHQQPWPIYDAEAAADEVVTLVVQVNGKLRDRLQAPVDVAEEEATRLALASEGAQRHVQGKQVVKTVYVPGRLVNIIVK